MAATLPHSGPYTRRRPASLALVSAASEDSLAGLSCSSSCCTPRLPPPDLGEFPEDVPLCPAMYTTEFPRASTSNPATLMRPSPHTRSLTPLRTVTPTAIGSSSSGGGGDGGGVPTTTTTITATTTTSPSTSIQKSKFGSSPSKGSAGCRRASVGPVAAVAAAVVVRGEGSGVGKE
eukprot:RCo018192